MARQDSIQSSLPDLPIHACIGTLRDVLSVGNAVLTAEPGSGKTTLVPLLLLDEPWLVNRKILILEPRRPAARMAAHRMAVLLGEQVGETVGYQVRFDRRVGNKTRIEVLTEGLLLRRLQADPELPGVGLVVFDEFHERNLFGDLSLALCLDVCSGLRDDLRLLAMSASLDAEALTRLMSATPVTAAGRSHPVSIHHATGDPEPRQLVTACVRSLDTALSTAAGDVLVFLPGRREIEQMRDAVNARWGATLNVEVLHGDLPAADQDAVLLGHGECRRVILSTDIAETSLTIDGVDLVVDSGLARRPAFDAGTGLTRLETRWISQAAALQRAGRAGRLRPGHCFRVWTPARHSRLQAFTPAEIIEADLAPLVLELANWGVASADDLAWLDALPPAHWQQAVELLEQLGALEGAQRVTPAGRQMARLPTHPRLAHMLVTARGEHDLRLAADLAALLSERDPLRHGRQDVTSVDIDLRLHALADLRAGTLHSGDLDRRLLKRIDQSARQLYRLASGCDDRDPTSLSAGAMLALAYPERVAQCASADGRRYLMRNGRAAILDVADPLCGSRFLAIAAVDAGRRDGRVWQAARLDEDELSTLFADAILVRREVRWDPDLDDVVARDVCRLDALLLDEQASALQSDDPVAEIVFARIRERGLGAVFDDPEDLRARVEILRRLEPERDWPDFSEQGLLANLESWLAPWIKPGSGIRQMRSLDLADVLRVTLGWERAQQLDERLPTHWQTPAGTRRVIDYVSDAGPTLAVPLQEMLGLGDGPRLAGGRVAVLLHLLSPAGRPLQVTGDLAAFWKGAYSEVKKEMRGRYPKHDWPDDPANATATRFTRRHKRR